MRRFRAGAAVVIGLVVIAGAACGGAAPSEAPAAAPQAPAGTVHSGDENSPEGSLAELDAAERRIFAAIGGPAGRADALGPGGDPAKKEEPGAGAQPPGDPARAAAPTTEQDSCSIACSALGSMKRATERLCGLTGEGDDRCTGARGRVGSASERVRASCPACAG